MKHLENVTFKFTQKLSFDKNWPKSQFVDILAGQGTINRQKQYQKIFQNSFVLAQIDKTF